MVTYRHREETALEMEEVGTCRRKEEEKAWEMEVVVETYRRREGKAWEMEEVETCTHKVGKALETVVVVGTCKHMEEKALEMEVEETCTHKEEEKTWEMEEAVETCTHKEEEALKLVVGMCDHKVDSETCVPMDSHHLVHHVPMAHLDAPRLAPLPMLELAQLHLQQQ